MQEETLTRRFAHFADKLKYEDLSRNYRQKLKMYFLDWLGCAYAGGKELSTRIILDVVKSLGGDPHSTIVCAGMKSSCLFAALVNGASSHVIEMDDLHRESILHPAAAIMPALYAIAERENISGAELLVAIAVGYEVGIRVAIGVGASHYRFWHTTSTCGTFGAAAASSKILNLDEDQFVWAMGSAGTQAAGLWQFLSESAMSKQLHPGKAAFNGLLSALLAKNGFTGSSKILEGEKGFFRATSQDFDEEKCMRGLGQDFLSERNSIKFHASCGHTHSAIDACLKATDGRLMSAREIKEIKLRIYQAALDLLGKVEPSTPYLAKFNLPFSLATAIKYGRVSIQDFGAERIKDHELLKLMKKVKIESDEGLSKFYPREWPASIEIHTSDGQILVGSSNYPKGDPENPLSDQEIIDKFKILTDGFLTNTHANAIVERVMHLENLREIANLLDCQT